MNFDVGEIGATLLIGAFVLLLLDGIMWYATAFDLTGFFRGQLGWEAHRKTGDGPESPPWVPFWVFVSLSLPAGIIAEDVATRIIEDRPQVVATLGNFIIDKVFANNGIILGMAVKPLKSKEAMRTHSLIRNAPAGDDARYPGETISMCSGGVDVGPCIEPLLQQLATGGHIVKVCEDLLNDPNTPSEKKSDGAEAGKPDIPVWDAATVEASLRAGRIEGFAKLDEGKQRLRAQQLNTCLSQIYYRAKNRSYLEQSYFDEMRRIEIRRRMTASLALYSISVITPMWMLILSTQLIWVANGSKVSGSDPSAEQRRAPAHVSFLLSWSLCFGLSLMLHQLLLFSSQGIFQFPLPNQNFVYGVLSFLVATLSAYSAERLPFRIALVESQKSSTKFPFPVLSGSIATGFLITLYLTGLWAYGHESNELNRRAYGYYLELARRDASIEASRGEVRTPTPVAPRDGQASAQRDCLEGQNCEQREQSPDPALTGAEPR